MEPVVSPLNFASFSIAAIFICLTCQVYMMLQQRHDRLQSKLFIAIIIDVALTTLANMVAEICKLIVPDMLVVACTSVANFLYFPLHMALGPLFCLYVAVVCNGTMRRGGRRDWLLAIPFIIVEVLSLTNPFTGWVYYYDAAFQYTRNWALYILYVVSFGYMVLGVITLMRGWKAITPRRRAALAYFFVMAFLGIVVQLIDSTVRIELFMESMAVVGVMLFVEDESDLIDSESGVYNRQALKRELRLCSEANQPYYVVVVRIVNSEEFTLMGGAERTVQITAAVSGYLKTIVPWYHLYRATPMQYALLDPNLDQREASAVAEEVNRRFLDSWDIGGMALNLHAVVALAAPHDEALTVNDMLFLLDSPLPRVVERRVLAGDDLNYLIRRADVERAIQRGFDNHAYEVYYQPVYRADGSLYGVEALMRLHDSVLGNVPPDEFIEVAERSGRIEDIGDFALEQTCAFLASGVPQQLGIQSVNVNLSVVQCVQPGFADHVESILQKYGVRASSISFEITESVAATNGEQLHDVMADLRSRGHQFAMDDYGTGYSNMHSFLTLDFDVIKVDKSVLWDAEKSEVGRAILENSMNMLRSAGSTVLVEGVETADQVHLLRGLGANYLQGFFFARPMPEAELIEALSANVEQGSGQGQD